MVVSIDYIIKKLKEKNISEEDLLKVRKAYKLADEIHAGVVRESGEPYIVHPLSVAINLINEMDVYDVDTICAALLHDTIEDAKFDFSKEDIAREISHDCAIIVDGVTKMRRMNFSDKASQNRANFRKILTSFNVDSRIIIVKLADRLHNMRTLQFKKENKQKDNARETLNVYVPLALAIGAYQIKNDLEDLSLMYLQPDDYKRINEDRESLKIEAKKYLDEIKSRLDLLLTAKDIPSDIIFRAHTINSMYKRIQQGYKIENIYDLFYLKVITDEVDNCYKALGIIHGQYKPINGRFKDYICNPKTNYYQSLHTTVITPYGYTKIKIRKEDMNKVAAHGIPALWRIDNGMTIESCQEMIRERCQFAQKIAEIDKASDDDIVFEHLINDELLTEHVYVYTSGGVIIELPAGSTAADFAVQVNPDLIDRMTGVLVNGIEVPFKTKLKNNDIVQIITNSKLNEKSIDGDDAYTITAKEKILNRQI